MIESHQIYPILLPFIVSALCSIMPLLFVGKRYTLPIYGYTAAIFIWSVGVLLRISATTVEMEAMWHTVRMLGPSLAAASFFLFAAQYTEQEKWNVPRKLLLLAVIPTITMILGFTNPMHGLLRSSVVAVERSPYVMEFKPGIWYFIHAGYSYIITIIGLVWLMADSPERSLKSEKQRQKVVILISAALVLTANVAFNIDLTVIDWTPIAGGVWAVMSVVVARRYRIFGLTPLARKAVVEEISQGVITVDQSCEITDMNPAAQDLLKKDAGELIGKNASAAFEKFSRPIEPCIVSNEQIDKVRTEDGQYFSIAISEIQNTSGEIIGKTVTLNDVTEREMRKSQLEEQKTALEHTNAELEEKRQELQNKNERLERFTGIVTHDLRNPLSVILGHAEILQSQVTQENQHLNEIEETANQMDSLIGELLELSRLGDTINDTENIPLKDIATDAWENVALQHCELEVDISPATNVEASKTELQRVFENLYRNADEHNEGELKITVGEFNEVATTEGEQDKKTGFYVEDTGSGIPDMIKEDIFKRGYSSNDNGTGFGLSVVSEIIEAHEWEIDVADSSKGGARFEITGVSLKQADQQTEID